jgi:hypothetical protein
MIYFFKAKKRFGNKIQKKYLYITKGLQKAYKMGRTKPVSVRFDPEKLNLVQLRESLTSPQKVVDYLVDAYYWQYKLNPASKNGQPTTEFEAFETQIRDADQVEILELVKWAVIRSKSLNSVDRQLLMETIKEKILKLKNQ